MHASLRSFVAALRRVPSCNALRVALALAVIACGVCAPGSAAAYEDQSMLGLGAGHALHRGRHGLALALSGSVGLDESLALRGVAAYAWHPGAPPLHVGAAGGELVYAVDVLELVPFFGLGAGALIRAQDGALRADAASHVVLGADYLLSRALTLTLELRPQILLTDLRRDALYTTATVSLSWMFDN